MNPSFGTAKEMCFKQNYFNMEVIITRPPITPKERAKKVLWKFLPPIEGWTGSDKSILAQKLSLIYVDGIIESMIYDLDGNARFPLHPVIKFEFDYWCEVKKELELF